jgi:hypothetical protein
MTKAIGILIIVVVIWGGYELFEVWNRYDTEQDIKQKQAEAARNFSPESLPGMPPELRESWQKVDQKSVVSLRNWLKANGARIQDPRRAWIELDYVLLVSHEDVAEAKKVFADVKARTPENSPVYDRIKKLEKTYE